MSTQRLAPSSLRPALALAAALAAPAAAGPPTVVYVDDAGDAEIRRTDTGNDAPISPTATRPDFLSLEIGGWQPNGPADHFNGAWIEGAGADVVRINVQIDGLVNPSGKIVSPFDPFEFGENAVFMVIEFDLDGDVDTGGQCSDNRNNRFLGNIARWGHVPTGPLAARFASSRDDYDNSLSSAPQFHRSGEEFTLFMCGCYDPSLEQELVGDGDTTFESGESWIVRDRIFLRSIGFTDFSGNFGGFGDGNYNPLHDSLWVHDAVDDVTTISIVWPLTMAGAALLTGEFEQGIDFDVSNHYSVQEALFDVIFSAEFNDLAGCWDEIQSPWAGRNAADYLDPTQWHVSNAIFGMSYAEQETTGFYVWTDFALTPSVHADFTGNGEVNAADEVEFDLFLLGEDGGPHDADGQNDGVFSFNLHSRNFQLYDLENDGDVDADDRLLILPDTGVPGDTNGDDVVDLADLNALLGNFPTASGATLEEGDVTGDGAVDIEDLNLVLGNWS